MREDSSAIQHVAEDAASSVVRSLVGHGVGRRMHEDPQAPNYGKPARRRRCRRAWSSRSSP